MVICSLHQARSKLQSELRNMNADLDQLRENYEEEQEGRADTQRQLTKANAELQDWRSKVGQYKSFKETNNNLLLL